MSERGVTVGAVVDPLGQHDLPAASTSAVGDLADRQDRAALAAHLTDKAAGRPGTRLSDLDAALDQIDAVSGSGQDSR